MRVSVFTSPQLQAVILKLKNLDRDVAKVIRQTTKADIAPAWKQAVAQHALNRLEVRVLSDTARVAVSNQNIVLSSATVGRKLSGGLNPKTEYAAAEFGVTNPDEFHPVETRSRKGTPYTAKRRTQRQFRARKSSGHVVYPAAADMIPRIISLWVQDIMHVLGEATSGK